MKEENVILKNIYKLGKVIVILLILIFTVLVIGVSKLYSDNNVNNENNTEENYNAEYDVSMFKEITASEISSLTKNNLSVIYIGRETCSWCAAFLPNLWEAQDKFKYTTLYIDIAKIIDFENGGIIDQKAYDTMTKITGEGYEDYVSKNFGSTPMILIMKDNKIINAQTGYSEYDEFESILTESGFKE